MRGARDSIVARHAVTQIHRLSQPDSANQFEVAPDGAVPDRPIHLANSVEQFIHGDMFAQLEKRAKDQFPLLGHLEPFGLQEFSHPINLPQTPLVEINFHLQLSVFGVESQEESQLS
jgi:hypothetical protein